VQEHTRDRDIICRPGRNAKILPNEGRDGMGDTDSGGWGKIPIIQWVGSFDGSRQWIGTLVLLMQVE